MATRIRDNWRTDKSHSLQETATAVAHIIWQLGLHFTKHLHEEKFDYDSDHQRISVAAEYLVFLSHTTDRMSHQVLSKTNRKTFMTSLVDNLARHYQSNVEAVIGSDDYRTPFIELMNKRFEQYSNGKFQDGVPGYGIRRLFANTIQDIMGMSQTNRWIVQQIIDIDAPDAVEKLNKSIFNLLGSAN